MTIKKIVTLSITCTVLLVIGMLLMWPEKPTDQCPEWFAEHVFRFRRATECTWEGRPSFILPYRGLLHAIAYAEEKESGSGKVVERIYTGFVASGFEWLEGKKYAEVRVFGPVVWANSKYASRTKLVGHSAWFKLDIKDLLSRGYGQFELALEVERMGTPEELRLIRAPRARVIEYELDAQIIEKRDRLIIVLGDPRAHLFYFESVHRGKEERVGYWLDQWYAPNGKAKRVVATRMTWSVYE